MAAPSMFGVMADRALDSAVEVAQQQLLLARAHAQSSGRPVEVIYRSEPPRVIARYFERGERGIDTGEFRAGALREEGDVFAEDQDEATGAGPRAGTRSEASIEDADALSWRWARQALPRGVSLRRDPPVEMNATEISGQAGGFEGIDSGGRLEGAARSERPTRLAVFMADGSALLARPVWLLNERGRSMRVEVSTWTGLARVEEWNGAGGELEGREAFDLREAASGREVGR